jgi:hypothetical protein
MTNEQAKSLLLGVRLALMSAYPFARDSTVDCRYALTMGFAMGVISEGLNAVHEDRRVRVDDRHKYLLRKLVDAADRRDLDALSAAIKEARAVLSTA